MEIDQAINGYTAKRKELEGAWNKPSLLGDILLKLATYLSYIGDELGSLKEQYEVERAAMYYHYLKQGKSGSQAENLARSDNAALKGMIAKIELTHKNGWSLVSIGQSRLRGLESEARNQQ